MERQLPHILMDGRTRPILTVAELNDLLPEDSEWEVTGLLPLQTYRGSRRYVLAVCTRCGVEREKDFSPLRIGKSKRCKTCYNGKGEKAARWKGGRTLNSAGYVNIFRPEHPAASNNGYVLEHRLVMEGLLSRYLLPDENVHHINGVRTDNRPENLELWSISQPPGQRVEDKISWAIEYLEQHGYRVTSSSLDLAA